jgi:hypothetical protein
MNTPQQIQDLVSETVHAHPAAQIELDPLPSGVCFLWVTVNGRNFALEYHPVEGVGVSENTPQTIPFAGHDQLFPTLDEAVTFYKQLLAGAEQSPPGPFSRTAYSPTLHLKSH